MTDTPAHTPLPWGVEEGHIQRDSNGIRYWQITDGQDAIACNQFCYAGNHPAMNAANAAFIVRACNSHYQLVGALREAIDAIEDDRGLDDYICCNGYMCGCQGSSKRQLMLHDLRAALSQAGGAGE